MPRLDRGILFRARAGKKDARVKPAQGELSEWLGLKRSDEVAPDFAESFTLPRLDRGILFSARAGRKDERVKPAQGELSEWRGLKRSDEVSLDFAEIFTLPRLDWGILFSARAQVKKMRGSSPRKVNCLNGAGSSGLMKSAQILQKVSLCPGLTGASFSRPLDACPAASATS